MGETVRSVMRKPVRRLGRCPSLCIAGVGALAAVLVFSAALLSGAALYERAVKALRDEVRTGLIRSAATASGFIDGDLHRHFTTPSQERSAEYARALIPLQRILQANRDVRYIYTCVLV